jgi:VanZ family protein
MIHYILKKSLWFSIIWTLVIFILCCTPGKYIPTSNWLELLSFDKFVHASIFFVLCTLWFLVIISKMKINSRYIGTILIGCVGYGGLLEIMQATIFSQRSGDCLDFIANSFGCLLALLFFWKKKLFQIKDNNLIL